MELKRSTKPWINFEHYQFEKNWPYTYLKNLRDKQTKAKNIKKIEIIKKL